MTNYVFSDADGKYASLTLTGDHRTSFDSDTGALVISTTDGSKIQEIAGLQMTSEEYAKVIAGEGGSVNLMTCSLRHGVASTFDYKTMQIGDKDPDGWVCLAYKQLPNEGGVNAGKRLIHLVAPDFYTSASGQTEFTRKEIAAEIPLMGTDDGDHKNFAGHKGSQKNLQFRNLAQLEAAALRGETDDGASLILRELVDGRSADGRGAANVNGHLLQQKGNPHLSGLFKSLAEWLVTNTVHPDDPRLVSHVRLDGLDSWDDGDDTRSRGCFLRTLVA